MRIGPVILGSFFNLHTLRVLHQCDRNDRGSVWLTSPPRIKWCHISRALNQRSLHLLGAGCRYEKGDHFWYLHGPIRDQRQQSSSIIWEDEYGPCNFRPSSFASEEESKDGVISEQGQLKFASYKEGLVPLLSRARLSCASRHQTVRWEKGFACTEP